MKLRYIFIIIFIVLLLPIGFSLPIYANISIHPFQKEVLISNNERKTETLTFTNDTNKEINISPKVLSYDAKNQELIDTETYIFVKTDKEIFNVKAHESLTLSYEIIPPDNILPGTYFNIIILQTQSEESFIQGENPIGLLGNISQLVIINVVDSESQVKGISTEFAQISIEIVNKGIPFIKPTIIKYTMQNTSNYVLNPVGEIQIFNQKGKYEPLYIKINSNEIKLYPKDKLEQEFTVKDWNISDIFNPREIVGRFYNGIDENYLMVNIQQQPNYLFLTIIALIFIGLIILVKSICEDIKNSKRKKTTPSK